MQKINLNLIRTTNILLLITIILNKSLANDLSSNQIDNRDSILRLLDWKFIDIALECERILGPKGWGAVHVSPVQEHAIVVIPHRPWWERYHIVSYKIITRSGNEDEFLDMTRRCNAAGVRIYVEVVIGHMSAIHEFPIVGTGWSEAQPINLEFPAVPYFPEDFNAECTIEGWQNATQLRNCRVDKFLDLNLAKANVRETIITFLNHLIELGVAGFIVNNAKHIWPDDLEYIFDELDDLNVEFNFPKRTRAFVYLDMVDYASSSEDIGRWEYIHIGRITEYMMTGEIGRTFKPEKNAIKWLKNWGPQWAFTPPEYAMAMIDSPTIQRDLVPAIMDVVTFREPQYLRIGTIWMLAHPYGIPIVMSSFDFQDIDDGPPHDSLDVITSPGITDRGDCSMGWICEHRWTAIANMIGFRNAVYNIPITRWWDNGNRHIALCRGDKGFIAFNTEQVDLDIFIYTNLPAGIYCDVITGEKIAGKCTGTTVTVDAYGWSLIAIPADAKDTALAIHVEAAIRFDCYTKDLREFIKRHFYTTSDVNPKFTRKNK